MVYNVSPALSCPHQNNRALKPCFWKVNATVLPSILEGAAIAQVSYLNKVPFVILRTISDKADDSATMDYPAFEKLAIANNVKVMKELVANI